MLQTTFVENIKTHIVYSVTFFFENGTIYKVMWKNIVEPDRLQMTLWCMCISCWITKDTDTHSIYYSFSIAKIGYMNKPQCYIICMFPALLFSIFL
jgi:hypothetical protein